MHVIVFIQMNKGYRSATFSFKNDYNHYISAVIEKQCMSRKIFRFFVNISTVHIQYPEKLKYEAYMFKNNITAVTFTFKTKY